MTSITDTCSYHIRLSSLSKREHQVALKILEGLSNKSIAAHLFISERTVKFHCANIYRKLEIRNRSALMASYFRYLYQPKETTVANG